MYLLILILGALSACLASGEGWALPAVAVVATAAAGVSARPLVRAARGSGYRPVLATFPPIPLGVHTAALVLLVGIGIAGLVR